jgi:fructose-specific phosphotransferase system IIA component
MRIRDILKDSAIIVGLKSDTKKAVLEEMVKVLHEQGALADRQKMLEVLLSRESLGSTGIGQGIAIPHGKAAVAKELTAACGISRTGVDFDALDDEKVFVIFLLVAPEEQASQHLKALARVSALLKDKYFRKALIAAQSPEDVIRVLEQEEKSRKP